MEFYGIKKKPFFQIMLTSGFNNGIGWFHENLVTFKGGPEPLEKEIHEILCSKREDRLSNHFVENWYKKGVSFMFRNCSVVSVRARGHCKRFRRSARR